MRKMKTKMESTMRRLQAISSKKSGEREEGLPRLLQSFATSHVAYTAAYDTWTQTEKAKIDTMIRRMYKQALVVSEWTSGKRLLQLSTHNMVDELIEAQMEAQWERCRQPRQAGSSSRHWAHDPEPRGDNCKNLPQKRAKTYE